MKDNEIRACKLVLTDYNPYKSFEWHLDVLRNDLENEHEIYVCEMFEHLDVEDIIKIMKEVAE